ncbi:MAG: DUF222 domain-containing protein [bacterium]|nr:DUF222 domain-containing protein [bacterium]
MRVEESRGRPADGGRVSDRNRARFVPPAASLSEASISDLRQQIRSITRAESQAAAARGRVAAEYTRRLGQKAAEKMVRQQSGQSARGSRSEVEVANKLKKLPGTRQAFEDGEISYGHARIIADTADRVGIDEDELVHKARKQPVDVFAHTARQHEQQRSEDDGLSKLESQKKARKAWIRTDRSDGMVVLGGRFDPITGALIKDALSVRTDQMWREEDPEQRPTTAQRMADAISGLLCEPGTTEPGKEKADKFRRPGATLLLIAHYDAKGQRIRDATLADGTPVPVAVFRDWACQGRVVPSVFDTRGQPLWVGMSKRLATRPQRLALIARDRGCVGCGADPAWCQAHHIVPWEADGPTDIDNLVLLCSRCHHQVHDDGWRIQQTPDGKRSLRPPAKGHRPPPSNKIRRRRRSAKPKTKLLL